MGFLKIFWRNSKKSSKKPRNIIYLCQAGNVTDMLLAVPACVLIALEDLSRTLSLLRPYFDAWGFEVNFSMLGPVLPARRRARQGVSCRENASKTSKKKHSGAPSLPAKGDPLASIPHPPERGFEGFPMHPADARGMGADRK